MNSENPVFWLYPPQHNRPSRPFRRSNEVANWQIRGATHSAAYPLIRIVTALRLRPLENFATLPVEIRVDVLAIRHQREGGFVK